MKCTPKFRQINTKFIHCEFGIVPDSYCLRQILSACYYNNPNTRQVPAENVQWT
jgi:hypothetical protein